MANVKTNAMRILDKAGIPYKIYTYEQKDGLVDGISVAGKIGQPFEKVYKTLVTQGASREYYVFIVPVNEELNLKAASKSVNEKNVEMIKSTDITKVTGYIRGGCSPVGMKKEYKTVLDSSCNRVDRLIVSAGKIGYQIEIATADLIRLIRCEVESIVMDKQVDGA